MISVEALEGSVGSCGFALIEDLLPGRLWIARHDLGGAVDLVPVVAELKSEMQVYGALQFEENATA